MDIHTYAMARLLVEKGISSNLEETKKVLDDYWKDKIAHIWSTEEIIITAKRIGVPINYDHALTILNIVEKNIDSQYGVSWSDIESALESNRMEFSEDLNFSNFYGAYYVRNPLKEYPEDYLQFGDVFNDPFDNSETDNLQIAIQFAKELSARNLGITYEIGVAYENNEYNDRIGLTPWIKILNGVMSEYRKETE